MKRGAKLFVKGYDGNACGPFRWTTVREWVATGSFTPEDEVRSADETAWSRIAAMPELLTPPPGDGANPALNDFHFRAREQKAVGPRAAAYLKLLGCPVPPQRLNPFTAFQWVQILEELYPQRANATERWAAEEESKNRVPSASPDDATPAQLESLRALGHDVSGKLTRLEAHRLISGPPTEGQLRRLTFYKITLPEGACKDEAAERIDRYMRENWHTEEAYQAYRKRSMAEASEPHEPAAAALSPPPPAPATEEVVPSPAARPLPPLPGPTPRTFAPYPRRRPVSIYLIVSGLVGLGIIGVTWSIAKRRSGADVTQRAPPSPTPGERAAPLPGAQPAGRVTVLESRNQPQGEQLRAFVLALPLTGVMGGAEPRALIDGRMYRVGDVIDRARGVFVLQVDLDKNTVAFGDAAGNIVQRVLE